MRITERKPIEWNGVYILKCVHSLNSNSKIRYAMYCNIIGETKNGLLKIRVFGNRRWFSEESRIRYVEKRRVALYSDYFED